jgi:DNA-binding MarR family transcriptional regulator
MQTEQSPRPEAALSAPAEPATVEEAVLVATMRLGRRMRQRLPGEELEFSSIALLKALAHQGALRLTDLAGVLDLDASTVSRHVRTLEERGLVARTTDPDDGRASLLAVTDEGRERLHAGGARRRALVAEMLQDWSPEDRETLRRLLTRLADDVQEHRR